MTDSDRSNAERARQLETLDRLAQRFGNSLSSAFDRNLNAGRQLDGVLASLASKLSNVAVKAALAPVKAGVTSLVNSLLSAASEGSSTTAFAKGASSPMGGSCHSASAAFSAGDGCAPSRPGASWRRRPIFRSPDLRAAPA
ncbi:hypothetical protein MKK50_20815 [Methylobacterium sp. J-043]|nr:hypothetical protein [Methylobacterium sp. J-043]